MTYCARLGFANLDSARQSQIERSKAPGPTEEHHSQIGKGDDKDRFGKVAASPNSQNLSGRSIPRSCGTHDGSFHADEVTACALLLCFDQVDRSKIRRTRDPKVLASCEYVCDVGGEYNPKKKRFDHHQNEYVGPLSSAGMILLYLKEEGHLDEHLYRYYNDHLILGVDAHDNGRAKLEPGTSSFSQVISNFLPIEYGVSDEEMQEAFFAAVAFVEGHLNRMKKRRDYALMCKARVEKEMAHANYALIFDELIPWMDNFFELGGELHPARFVVMPSGDHWKLRCIPPSPDKKMQVRTPLPLDWAGLREEELSKVSGIKGAIFCHKGRFISIWETKEAAIHALHQALYRT